jgi:hypothetical protein
MLFKYLKVRCFMSLDSLLSLCSQQIALGYESSLFMADMVPLADPMENARRPRVFRIADRQTIEADLDIYNLTNNGAGQQFVNGNNAASATFRQLRKVQPPRSAQISLRYHFQRASCHTVMLD